MESRMGRGDVQRGVSGLTSPDTKVTTKVTEWPKLTNERNVIYLIFVFSRWH